MKLKSYYHEHFPTQLVKMIKNRTDECAGFITFHELKNPVRGIPSISAQDRAPFVLCLFITILVDQAMHAYGPKAVDFASLARYPQWGVLGGANSNPWGIIAASLQFDLVRENEIEALAEDAGMLFVDEIVEFFTQFLPHHSAQEFLVAITRDSDVGEAVLLRAGVAGIALFREMERAIVERFPGAEMRGF